MEVGFKKVKDSILKVRVIALSFKAYTIVLKLLKINYKTN